MNLFGCEVPLKIIPCTYNGVEQKPDGDNYVNLYVRLTDTCNAACEFCEFRNRNLTSFDFYKFYYVLHELKKKVRINKISFTGGEPTFQWELLNECLRLVKSLDENIFTIVNSNGFNLHHVNFEYLNSFALSRHGIEFQNYEIFQCDVMSDMELKGLEQCIKDKIHLSCNLIKGYIDDEKDMYDFINHYSRLGFHEYGFVSLMKVNEYCRSNHVDFMKINLNQMKNTRRVCTFNDKNACFCANYVTFDDDGDLNRWYARHYCDMTKADSNLVFDIDHLKVGFNGPVIVP